MKYFSLLGNLISTKELIRLILLVVLVILCVNFSVVSNVGSDPRGSLLLSQNIMEHLTIRLDNYDNLEKKYGWNVHIKNKHYYYYFPLGSSLSSIPFVWFERYVFKKNMYDSPDEYAAQRHIASIVSAFIFFLLFLIANCFLNVSKSLVVSSVFWFGTSFSSTLGTALWSHDFGCLYSLIAIYLSLLVKDNKSNNFWYLIPICLFMAYLTRPTLSLLSIALVPYLAIFNRKIAINTAVLLASLLGLFILFSMLEFGQLLPDYYTPNRLSSDHFWTALYGNLFSPARGLFIYSPFLCLFLVNYKETISLFRTNKSLLLILAWVTLHLVMISKFPHWWAGYSYGPRFMVDVLPGIFVLFVGLLRLIQNQPMYKRIFILISMLFSIYVNAIHGMFNSYSSRWNAEPNIDKNPQYLFDWKYPQFLHNRKRHNDRLFRHLKKDLKVIT